MITMRSDRITQILWSSGLQILVLGFVIRGLILMPMGIASAVSDYCVGCWLMFSEVIAIVGLHLFCYKTSQHTTIITIHSLPSSK